MGVMGPLSSAVLIGCLKGLHYLLWLAAGLLAILVITQALRGDADARPGPNLAIAAVLFAGGAVSGYVARKLTPK